MKRVLTFGLISLIAISGCFASGQTESSVDAITSAEPAPGTTSIPQAPTSQSATTLTIGIAATTGTTASGAALGLGGLLTGIAVLAQGDTFPQQESKPKDDAKDIKRLTDEEIKKRTNSTSVHDPKKDILKDNADELKKAGMGSNPDIGVDKKGNTVLIDRRTGKTLNTGVPLTAYRR